MRFWELSTWYIFYLFVKKGFHALCNTRTKKWTLDEECEVGALTFSSYHRPLARTARADATAACRCETRCRCRLARPISQPSSNRQFYALVSQCSIECTTRVENLIGVLIFRIDWSDMRFSLKKR